MGIKVFWCEPTDRRRLWLRRYERREGSERTCPTGRLSIHNARAFYKDEPARYQDSRHRRRLTMPTARAPRHADPRWPVQCEACEYRFTARDYWQVFQELIYRLPDGREAPLDELPVGAMWNAWWLNDWYAGPDGLSLMVRTPGGDWLVDGEASNCTDPAVKHPKTEGGKTWHERTHRCWIRHGDPRTGQVHVDKNGPTCAAGAGSIAIGGYHGFLHNGELTPA